MNPQCKLCALGVGYEPDLSQRQLGKQYGVGKSSVARHRRHLPGGEAVLVPEGDVPAGMVVDRMSVRDPDTGSWTKYRVLDPGAAMEEVYESVDAAELLNRLDRSEGTAETGGSVFVMSLNDTQLGKGEGGGTEATVLRVQASVRAAQVRVGELRSIGRDLGSLIIIGGGDIIEGCNIYPNQVISNDLTQSEQVETAVTLVLWVIDQMAPMFEHAYVLATKGNHGENRVGGAKTAPRDNNDTMVFRLAEQATQRDTALRHLEYIICEPEEEAVYMDVPGTPWMLGTTHGDIYGKFVQGTTKMLKAWNWYKNKAVGRDPMRPDVLITHHFHHEEKADWGSCLWVQTRAQDGGSAYFEQFSGQYSESGMLSFVMTPTTRYKDEAIL